MMMREVETTAAMAVVGLLLTVVAIAMVYVSGRFTRKPNPRLISCERSGAGTGAELELRAEELEKAGDLDGALHALKESHDRGSSRAVTLAHDLYQRHPGDAFQTKGCPMGASGFGQPSPLRTAASPAAGPCCAAPGTDVPAAASCAAPEKVSLAPAASPATVAAAAVLPSEEHFASDLGGEPRKLAEERRTSSAEQQAAPPQYQDGDCAGTAAGGVSETKATVAKESAALVSGRGVGARASAGESSETPSPWERGWQGPEGFKPPRSAEVTDSTTMNHSSAAGKESIQPKPSPRSSQNVNAGAQGNRGVEGLGGAETVVSAAAAAARNFTVSQLNTFNGGFPIPRKRGGEVKVGKPRPIYIALRGEVYDASAGRELYGPGGEYSEFAGHDISRRVARGVSKVGGDGSNHGINGGGSTLLDDLSLEGLDRFEQMTLRGWEDTFRARGYPRVGRVVAPPPPRVFSRAELRAFDGRPAAGAPAAIDRLETADGEGDRRTALGGTGGPPRSRGGEGSGASGGRTGGHAEGVAEGEGAEKGEEGYGTQETSTPQKPEPLPVPMPTPSSYAARPIYMGVRDKVFDVSFGGSEFYVAGGAYECLAGRDASRVLAKMSMKKEDVEGILDYSCLTDREEKNLADWVEKLGERGKGYPVVGWLDLGL